MDAFAKYGLPLLLFWLLLGEPSGGPVWAVSSSLSWSGVSSGVGGRELDGMIAIVPQAPPPAQGPSLTMPVAH